MVSMDDRNSCPKYERKSYNQKIPLMIACSSHVDHKIEELAREVGFQMVL
jgi:hypothetical protein